jgi:hypothetical protein
MIVNLALAITAITDIILTSQFSGTAIVAIRLEQKPETYFVIEQPDSYFLGAIADEGEPVFLGLFGDT